MQSSGQPVSSSFVLRAFVGVATLGAFSCSARLNTVGPATRASLPIPGELQEVRRHSAVLRKTGTCSITPIAITAVNVPRCWKQTQSDRYRRKVASQAAQRYPCQPNGRGPSALRWWRSFAASGRPTSTWHSNRAWAFTWTTVYYATLTGSVLDLLDLDRVENSAWPAGHSRRQRTRSVARSSCSRQKPTGDGGGYLAGDLRIAQSHRCARRRRLQRLADDLFARRVVPRASNHDGYVPPESTTALQRNPGSNCARSFRR